MLNIEALQHEFDRLAEGKRLCSPIVVPLKHEDVVVMGRAALEICSLYDDRDYLEHTSSFVPEVRFLEGRSHYPLWMIGVDFHVAEDGPKLIEVNSNAGGYVTSALWAHKNNAYNLKEKLSRFVLSLFETYQQWNSSQPNSVQIVDDDPFGQFTYYDMKLSQELFRHFGVISQIDDVSKASDQFDIIYNRSCDFLFARSESKRLRDIFISGQSFVFPNPYAFSLLSDKRVLVALNSFSELGKYKNLNRVLLPCKLIRDFSNEQMSRRGWVFKPAQEYAGTGVFRGKKISRVKYEEILNKDYVAQKEARPGTVDYEGETYKYDVRVFATPSEVLDISVRAYTGRLTNFRSENGGYARFRIVE